MTLTIESDHTERRPDDGVLESLSAKLQTALRAALRDDGSRLSRADTSVGICLAGTSCGATLLLDRPEPAVIDHVAAAEVTLNLSTGQAEAFCAGRLCLPLSVTAGEVGCRGPARKFLAVEPILRSLLAGGPFGNGRGGAGVDQDAWSDGFDGTSIDDTEEYGELWETGTATAVIDRDPSAGLAVETRDVHKSFGSHRVLAGLNLTVPEGALSVVMGPSGTGKSVLLKHIVGLARPDSGEILIRGRALSAMTRGELVALRRDIGVMYQDGALFSSMNVFDNVAFPVRQHTDYSESEVRDVVMEHLTSVGLAAAAEKYPGELSGGMKKRAGLARALVLDPHITVCDEPDSGLDPVRTALLGDLLIERHEALGGTMVVVTHNAALARLVGDHASVIWHGQIVQSGSAESIWNSDDPFVRQFVSGDCNGPLDMGE